MKTKHTLSISYLLVALFFLSACQETDQKEHLSLTADEHIIMIGGNLCSRMINYNHFEKELYLRYPDSNLYIRNMCDGGDTPGFRAHSGREKPWAFEGAEAFHPTLARNSGSKGFLETPNEWLTNHEASLILGFFGYSESFGGEAGVENFKDELRAFISHTRRQDYGVDSTRLALISPIAFENLSERYDLPNGITRNNNLELYTEAMREVATAENVYFVDLFYPTKEWFETIDHYLTIDGFQLTDEGYEKLSKLLSDELFGTQKKIDRTHQELVHEAVKEKNWLWHNDYKIPNGVHVFGRRYNPYGPDNYPDELKKIREMTALRDQAIWQAAKGEKMDLAAADAKTHPLSPVQTNYTLENDGYKYGDSAIATFTMAPGFEIDLFASEEEFEDLANPVQLTFDNKGRLWVAVMPTYPHWKPGDPKPNDKIIILEDTDNDGKADNQITFADGLHLPTGFEITTEGVYVSQGTNLVLLKDTNGDDRSDKKEIILSGFDDHDTHHVISAFCADPSGAIYMGEGVFLHTNVETSYGTVRATNGGFMRYHPKRKQIERTAQIPIPNPWGTAFDRWGQPFFAETSGPNIAWMSPATQKSLYGVSHHKAKSIIEEDHRVRPTSGLEFVSSRHFPEEMQGDMLVNNTIGFLGTKQHEMLEDGTGYTSRHRQDLLQSSDGNFRPVDMEFAPDGSLYLVDWHNILVGHMQHNARDPLRDHQHGRIYRITYPSRPLVEPAKIADASISELLDNLRLPEYRTRYRTRRELRGRDRNKVIAALGSWKTKLDENDPRYEHDLLEALWVSWGLNEINPKALEKLLKAKDHRVRAAAVRTLRYVGHQIDNQAELLQQAAADPHGRVRLEAVVAASWLPKKKAMPILDITQKQEQDEWIQPVLATAYAHINGMALEEKEEQELVTDLEGEALALYTKGAAVYKKDGSCITCHQANGGGLDASQFPPLAGTDWVLGNEERLIKIVLNGLYGPIEVLGKKYPGQVPMTAYGNMLNDEEIAAVLTYVRNSFGNEASVITPDQVTKVRDETADKSGFYTPEELLTEHTIEQ
ncbi:MAG: PVC-type heme-binding CxxCH protein [Bacteroidota bacterium]